MSQWFLNQNEKVRGPFTADQVKAQIAEGQVGQDCLIWGRSLESWQTVSLWMRELSNMPATIVAPIASGQMWHYAVDGDSKGPMTRVELVNELKSHRHNGEILVWTKGMKAWTDLYEFHDLLDEAGINRREHPRAPISGSVVVKFEDKTLIGLLKTISPGGFGASQLSSQLSIGQNVTVEIKSEKLAMPLTLKAAVQYTSDTGFYGFKFSGINMEAKAHILEYLKNSRHSAPATGSPAQAA